MFPFGRRSQIGNTLKALDRDFYYGDPRCMHRLSDGFDLHFCDRCIGKTLGPDNTDKGAGNSNRIMPSDRSVRITPISPIMAEGLGRFKRPRRIRCPRCRFDRRSYVMKA
ncbi:hypothetical protein RHECNPAF_9300133 [Rhizobium etli CNPAF512]|nr:hypothetical protein RHECNPAF_9300133 [Rhizobium etli CNPAF512]